jgi:hypothetical protein
MKKNQIDAIKQLETALLRIKRAGLVLVGIDDNVYASVDDEALQDEMRRSSSCEAILARSNSDHVGTTHVRHYGCYRDSGGA